MKTSVIAVTDVNGVIAVDGELPTACRPDLARPDMENFRRLTIGDGNNAIIMGRATHQSIGRVLRDRKNIVVSNKIMQGLPSDRLVAGYSGIFYAAGLKQAIAGLPVHGCEHAFVIGGHNLYLEALGIADTLYLTVLDLDAACSAASSHVYFPGFASLLMDMRELGPDALQVERGDGYAFLTVDLVARRALHKEAA
jgi:dihydrofolate reductase